jgi:transposase
MGRVNTPKLSESAKESLEKGYRSGKTHAFRQRCQLILLKSEGRKSKEVALIVKMCQPSVNSWTNRYNQEGISGLETKPGRGRKPILDKESDEAGILEAVKANRQRIDTAKAEWDAAHANKSVSRDTFRRFLKALAENTSESDADVRKKPTPNSTSSS